MAYKNLTYEQYKQEVYDICKREHGVVEAYPEEFEKEFEWQEKKGRLKKYYEKGYSPSDVADVVALSV